MDVTAIVSVASSATVALATLGINAWTKRGDRKHESALDYERRIWADKRAALVSVIGYCNLIRSACGKRMAGEPLHDVYRCVAVYKVFEQVYDGLSDQGGPLVAYADKSVWQPLEELTEIVEASRWDDFAGAISNRDHCRAAKESAIDDQDFTKAAELREREKKTVEKIEEGSSLDLEALRKLVASIIDAAKKDLSGQ